MAIEESDESLAWHKLHGRRRQRPVRARTIGPRDMMRGEERVDTRHLPILPKTRAECVEVERPCPFVSCSHNLYLDVNEATGALKINFPDLEPDQIHPKRSCVLDVAENGGVTLDAAGALMNITRERVRQIEEMALALLGGESVLKQFDPYEGLEASKRHYVMNEGGANLKQVDRDRSLGIEDDVEMTKSAFGDEEEDPSAA